MWWHHCDFSWASFHVFPEVLYHINEPAHFVLMYTPLFLLFYHSFSNTDPLPCTTLTKPSLQHVWAFTTAHVWCLPSWTHYQLLHQPSFIYILDGHMTYDLHCYISILSYPMCPTVAWPITSHHAMWSGDLLLFHYRWALCLIPWLSCIFNLPAFYLRIVNQRDPCPHSSYWGSLFCLIALCPLFLMYIHLALYVCHT